MSASVQLCRHCMTYFHTGTTHACPARAAGSVLDAGVELDPGWPDPPNSGHGAADGSAAREAEARRSGDADADVKNPGHYNRYKIEPITFIEENGIPYSEGNVIKYVCRWRHKDGIRDLKKAREYIDKMIRRAEEEGE